ncbi:hypothetical protein FHR81_004915 [Actinoalloteichus hoggarensis]|uniref:Uncharacterized protein n=1 Tax=Actinoalloteichus hoggarensis TaxID=1470176 RepID=A0A221W8Z2_9PSEU|nr:hypothetical protein AHOG_22310 [Actinoalloteichus hoggarensis]MBB5923842.1 hypothetical protein [Actinoalloteichus hoggarensis]
MVRALTIVPALTVVRAADNVRPLAVGCGRSPVSAVPTMP